MNSLSREKQFETISVLCDGVSVRATERLAGVNRGTILSLGVRVGDGCAKLHDAIMCGLHVGRTPYYAWAGADGAELQIHGVGPTRIKMVQSRARNY